jgi:phosphomevalonate kinase
MLMGEWSVLAGYNCVVTTVERGVTVSVEPSENFCDEHGSFAREAIQVVLRHLRALGYEIVPFKISINSTISPELGLGSSSAVVVAIVRAIFLFYGLDVQDKVVFELSFSAHYKVQGNIGSGYDVAAAVYGGPILYRLSNEISRVIKKITLPKNLRILVGSVGKGANTRKLVERVCYKPYAKELASCTEDFLCAIESSDEEAVLASVKRSRHELKKLGDLSGVELETPELKILCDIAQSCGGAAKFSGAGGGDCGVAFCFDREVEQAIVSEWERSGIVTV